MEINADGCRGFSLLMQTIPRAPPGWPPKTQRCAAGPAGRRRPTATGRRRRAGGRRCPGPLRPPAARPAGSGSPPRLPPGTARAGAAALQMWALDDASRIQEHNLQRSGLKYYFEKRVSFEGGPPAKAWEKPVEVPWGRTFF